jgi:histidinol dehydrogenase
MTTEPSRLEQIESLLFQTASSLNQVTQRLDTVTVKLDQVAVQQAANTQAISELKTDVRETLDILMYSIEHVEQDRIQATQDREAWQAEIRRIWEYLRDRNGGSYAA